MQTLHQPESLARAVALNSDERWNLSISTLHYVEKKERTDSER